MGRDLGYGGEGSPGDGRVRIWHSRQGGFCRSGYEEEALQGLPALFKCRWGCEGAPGWREADEGVLQRHVFLEGDEEQLCPQGKGSGSGTCEEVRADWINSYKPTKKNIKSHKITKK